MRINVAKAAKDYPTEGIKKGEIFYYCEPKSLRKSGDRRKKSKDKEDLEKWIKSYAEGHMGEHSSKMKDWEERKEDIYLQEDKNTILEEIEEWKSEKEENLNNIPEQLQEGHILNDQIQELEDLLAEVEEIEVEDEED